MLETPTLIESASFADEIIKNDRIKRTYMSEYRSLISKKSSRPERYKSKFLSVLIAALFTITAIFASESVAEKPVHLFILSGQSNMAGMDPETGFMSEAKKLFKDEKVVYIKVAKGGQPICRWLEEWQDIAKKNGLEENHIKRIHRGGKVEFYQPILDQYKGMVKKHPKFKSVTFCWMQ